MFVILPTLPCPPGRHRRPSPGCVSRLLAPLRAALARQDCKRRPKVGRVGVAPRGAQAEGVVVPRTTTLGDNRTTARLFIDETGIVEDAMSDYLFLTSLAALRLLSPQLFAQFVNSDELGREAIVRLYKTTFSRPEIAALSVPQDVLECVASGVDFNVGVTPRVGVRIQVADFAKVPIILISDSSLGMKSGGKKSKYK